MICESGEPTVESDVCLESFRLQPVAGLEPYLVFRKTAGGSPGGASQSTSFEFRLFESPVMLPRHVRMLHGHFGLAGIVKLLIKLTTPSRSLYAAFADTEMLSYGWIMRGKSRYYYIEPAASVIGPIYTRQEFRGRGLATKAMVNAIERLAERGRVTFYIDAHHANHASIQVFKKAGFLGPVAVVPKPATISGQQS